VSNICASGIGNPEPSPCYDTFLPSSSTTGIKDKMATMEAPTSTDASRIEEAVQDIPSPITPKHIGKPNAQLHGPKWLRSWEGITQCLHVPSWTRVHLWERIGWNYLSLGSWAPGCEVRLDKGKSGDLVLDTLNSWPTCSTIVIKYLFSEVVSKSGCEWRSWVTVQWDWPWRKGTRRRIAVKLFIINHFEVCLLSGGKCNKVLVHMLLT
jgi:hypothetical protein